jgi:hypothetical protein
MNDPVIYLPEISDLNDAESTDRATGFSIVIDASSDPHPVRTSPMAIIIEAITAVFFSAENINTPFK